MSNEDIWKIIKALFLWYKEDIEWLNKAYYDIIKVDLDNLEKTATNWNKWWRPKKKITWGYEKEKPEVIENDNLKKRERERESKRERKSEDKEKVYWIENNIQLSEIEYNKIKDRYWANILLDYIDRLSLYIIKFPDKYKSHYLTLLDWIKRDWVKEQVKPINRKKIYS